MRKDLTPSNTRYLLLDPLLTLVTILSTTKLMLTAKSQDMPIENYNGGCLNLGSERSQE